MGSAGLSALVVDDSPDAVDTLVPLLCADARVGRVRTARDAVEALRVLDREDVAFLATKLPGLDGFELASVLRRFVDPPLVVFVTDEGERLQEAFDVGAVDYLIRPICADRLAETIRRVASGRPLGGDDVIPVELAGRTWMLARSAVRWVQAEGDYARLHTGEGSHLVRVPLSTLAERWANAGFVRIHRSYLVPLRLIRELLLTRNGYVVRIGERDLPVSRRHARDLKDRLVRAAKAGWASTGGRSAGDD